jgi:hypothetical protein
METHTTPNEESHINLFALQSHRTEETPATLPSLEQYRKFQPQSQQQSRVRSTSRTALSRKTSAEVVKNNLLRSKQSRRIIQLKEVTSNNLQMFLRIQAQNSHYKFKRLSREFSCQNLRGVSKIKPTGEGESQAALLLRCQSAKTNLLSRCTELKQTICRDKIDYQSHYQPTIQIEESSTTRTMNSKRTLPSVSDKENQGNNSEPQKRQLQATEAAKKAIAKKLGHPIPPAPPKTKILITPEGKALRQIEGPQIVRFCRGINSSR